MSRRKKQRWSDLSARQRSAVAAAGTVQLALLVTALADLWRRPADQVRGSRPVWTAICFITLVGPVAYVRFGRRAG